MSILSPEYSNYSFFLFICTNPGPHYFLLGLLQSCIPNQVSCSQVLQSILYAIVQVIFQKYKMRLGILAVFNDSQLMLRKKSGCLSSSSTILLHVNLHIAGKVTFLIF